MNNNASTESVPNVTPLYPGTPTVANVLPSPPPFHKEQNHTKVSVGQTKVRGELTWYVSFYEDGKRKRAFKESKAQADALADEKRHRGLTSRQKLLLLPEAKQVALLGIATVADELKMSLYDVPGMMRNAPNKLKDVPTIKTVVDALMAEKTDSHNDEKYIINLRQSLAKFIKGREIRPVDQFTTEDVTTYLRPLTIGYKKTLRARICGLFAYAVRHKYIVSNPCDALPMLSKKAAKTSAKIHVFEGDEADKCLRWLAANPKGLAWFVKTAFAGLRPQDEACFTGWEAIHFNADPKKQYIVVDEKLSKTGHRRVVYAPAMVFDWLKWAKANGSELPLTLSEVRTIQLKLRKVLGWTEWKQDVTRHSAATYQLAMTNDVKKVSRGLGHSVSMLESTYDARRPEDEGVAYYNLTVDKYIAAGNLAVTGK